MCGLRFSLYYLRKEECKILKISQLIQCKHLLYLKLVFLKEKKRFPLLQTGRTPISLTAGRNFSLDLLSVPVWLANLQRPTKDQWLGKLLNSPTT